MESVDEDRIYRISTEGMTTMQKRLEMEPLLLRGGEVAEVLGCSRALAYRWMQNGVIPTVRVPGSRSVRVPKAALLAWIEKNTKQPTTGAAA
jgi:excisionase family DNA binding protein